MTLGGSATRMGCCRSNQLDNNVTARNMIGMNPRTPLDTQRATRTAARMMSLIIFAWLMLGAAAVLWFTR